MRLLLIGDIVGKPGRQIVCRALPLLIEREKLDLVIANGENAAGGSGITPMIYEELRRVARQHLGDERAGHTLQPTALVHEVYLKLIGEEKRACGGGCKSLTCSATDSPTWRPSA